MKALSLFSGIGGIDLACDWAGIETVAFCEREPFCQKVLQKHWLKVPIYDDVCTLTRERLEADGVGPIDIIFSGDPCQPYSIAGDREGSGDDRFLWPEVHRLLETIRPRWIVRENVAGNISLGLDGVLADLEDLKYTWQSFVIPAAAVGAIHRRDRVFVVAHANGQYVKGYIDQKIQGFQTLQGIPHDRSAKEFTERSNQYQPKLFRNPDGIPGRLDRRRIKALGNAVNPNQIYPILAAIKQIDDMMRTESA